MKFLNTDAIHESGTLLYNKPVKENFKITTAPCPVFKTNTHIDFTNYATYDIEDSKHYFNFQKVEFYYEPITKIPTVCPKESPEYSKGNTVSSIVYPNYNEFSSEDGIKVKVFKLIGIIGTNLFGEQTEKTNISQLCLYRAFELMNTDTEEYNITYYLYSYYSKGNSDYSKRYYLGENIPSGKYEVSYSSLTLNDKAIKGEAIKVDTTDIKYTTTQKYPIFGHSSLCASGSYYELKIYKSDNECPIYLPMQEGNVIVAGESNKLVVNVNYINYSKTEKPNINNKDNYCHTITNIDTWSTQEYCMYNTIHGYKTTDVTDKQWYSTIKYFPITNNSDINDIDFGGVTYDALKTGINDVENSVLVPNSKISEDQDGYKVSEKDYVNVVDVDIDSSVALDKNELYKFTATLEIKDSTLIGLLDSNTSPNPIFDIEFVLKLSGTNIKLIEFDNNCLKSTNNDSYTINVVKYFTAPANSSSVKLECSNIVYKYITDENVITGTSLLNTGFTITDIKLYKLTPKNETLSGTFYTKYAYNTDNTYIGQDTFTLYDNDTHDSEVYREWYYYLDKSKFENNYTNIEIIPLATGTLTCTVSPDSWTSTTKNSSMTFNATNTFIGGDNRIKLFNYEWNFKSGDNVLKNLMPTGENKKKNKLTITRDPYNVEHLKGGKATITCTSTLNPDYGLTTISSSTCNVNIDWNKIASSITVSDQSITGVENNKIYIGKNYTGTFTITTTYPLSNLNNNPISIDTTETNINFVEDTLSFSIIDPNSWATSGTYDVSYTFTVNYNTDITVSPAIYIKATDQNSPSKTEVLQCLPNNLSIGKYDLTVTTNLVDTNLDLYKADGDTETLTFICTANNNLEPNNREVNYQWYDKNDKAIKGATNSTYTINSADLDSGTYEYYCIASNKYSNPESITSGTVTCRVIEDDNSIVTVGTFSPLYTNNASQKYYVPDNVTVRYKNYNNVQQAIDSASIAGGGEVWIAKGIYYMTASAMTMKNNVAIYGGFAGTETNKDQRPVPNIQNRTILDGDRDYRVFYNEYSSDNPLTNSAKLDNVIIQNAEVNGSGAGMYNKYASPEITNCIFTNNSADYYGGGMCNDYSSPILTNCTFSGNSATNDAGDGGGMYNNESSSPVLTNCTFANNNASSDGGGMGNSSSSSPVLTNCTFSNNSASSSGGGVYNYKDSSPVLINCILWGNTASKNGNEIYNDFNSNTNPTIDTCIIQNGKSGIYNSDYGTYTNIITADPKLMPLGNYGGSVITCPVGAGSSAIGAGKVIDGLTTDARGFTRSATPSTIGACEYTFKDCNVSNPPVIKTTEGYTKYSSAYEFTLNIFVSGDNLTYQWYKDGKKIAGATSSSYKTTQSAGISKYTVVISDGTTSITSSEITIETTDVSRYYVSTEGSSENDGLSWATAKSDIQEAIDLASAHNAYGTEVWIAQGKYTRGSEMTMKNNVAIYGGFAGTETSKEDRVAEQNITYLDGEGKYRVFYNNYTEANPLANSAKLDNVTIQNGSAINGAGMCNVYASPEITNCTFNNNMDKATSSADGNSGGGAIYNENSNPTVNNCTFTNNKALHGDGGAIMNGTNSMLILTNCKFNTNTATDTGGAISNHRGSILQIDYCTFNGNTAVSGGAIENWSKDSKTTILTANYCYFDKNITTGNTANQSFGGAIVSNGHRTINNITGCTFNGNEAISGGAIYACDVNTGNTNIDKQYSETTLTNCTFYGNKTTYWSGGAIENKGSKLKAYYCTFTKNICGIDGVGAAIYDNNQESSTVLRNCILWNNKKVSESYSHGYSTSNDRVNKIDRTYCVIQNSSDPSPAKYPYIITDDPKLQSLANNGGSVQTCAVGAGSSAIGVGNVIKTITTDARGYIRPSENPTMGAYEYRSELTKVLISTSDGRLKYSSSYEFTLNAISGGTNLTYQWYKNGVAISGATSSSYKTTQSAGISKYYVVVSDGKTSITSSEIVIETINAPRYYVSTTGRSANNGLSWATAKSDVQEAIDLASAHNAYGTEVWITKGTYNHGSEMTMKNNVHIYGGFAGTETSKEDRVVGNDTILDGEGKYIVFDNNYSSSNPLTNSAKLDNVTIQNGSSGNGAGMYNNYASPEITNCTFSGNSASWGGGMYNYESSSPVLTNCTFSNNSASRGGGCMYNYYYSNPTIMNCTFTNNSASSDGGGMYNRESSPVLTNCTFNGNYVTSTGSSNGGGMYNKYSNPMLTNCTFSGNSAKSTAAASSSGGSIYNEDSDPILRYCTFMNNYALTYGGVMYNISSSSPILTNCILWGNTASKSGNEIYNYDTNNKLKIDTCVIKNGKNGIPNNNNGTYTNIITADPKLQSLKNNGGYVQTCAVDPGSSAIAAGIIITDVTTDARCFERSLTPTIGAYEYIETETT